jgi:hypothetical protein
VGRSAAGTDPRSGYRRDRDVDGSLSGEWRARTKMLGVAYPGDRSQRTSQPQLRHPSPPWRSRATASASLSSKDDSDRRRWRRRPRGSSSPSQRSKKAQPQAGSGDPTSSSSLLRECGHLDCGAAFTFARTSDTSLRRTRRVPSISPGQTIGDNCGGLKLKRAPSMRPFQPPPEPPCGQEPRLPDRRHDLVARPSHCPQEKAPPKRS